MSVAAIDIGSNSVRLLVVDDDGGEITRETVVTALGTGVERARSFDPRAYDATIDVIARYAATIRSLQVDDLRAVATSASRDADNGAALMSDIEKVLGIRPAIIEGSREADLSFLGALRGLDEGGSKLVIDVGGGSTEFVYGTATPAYSTSVDIGSVRLTDRRIGERPVPDATVSVARRDADAAFAGVDVPGTPDVAIGVAGTFTSLSAIALQLDAFDADAIHGSRLGLDEVTRIVTWLSKLSLEETASIPSLDPARARVILAGAVVVERSLVHCRLDAVTVSVNGLLDGLAYEQAGSP